MDQQQRKQKIEVLRKANSGKDVHLIVSKGREYYVATPSREIWHQFRDGMADPKRKKVATENFVTRCAIEPNAEQLGELFEKQPALCETLGNKLAVLAGIDEEAEVFFYEDD